jgi:hypothetical protein
MREKTLHRSQGPYLPVQDHQRSPGNPQRSLRLTNTYTDRMEGERDDLQKQSYKNWKREDNWKATAETSHAGKRAAVEELKWTEKERDAIASKLKEELYTKSVEISLAVLEAKVSNHTSIVCSRFAI